MNFLRKVVFVFALPLLGSVETKAMDGKKCGTNLLICDVLIS